MDEAEVRERAEAHAGATMAGDLRKAGGDLTPEAAGSARAVMAQMPVPITSVDVTEIRPEGDRYVAVIVYSGEESKTTVASTWEEQDGDPMITKLEVL